MPGYAVGPYDIQHVLLTWGGKLPGNESWSCSLRLAEQSHVPGSNYVPLEEEIASWLGGSIKDAVLAYHTRPGTRIHSAAKLSFAKLNAIGVNCKYLRDGNSHEYVFADVAGGSAQDITYPNQVALAVSLTTGYSRGPAHRGRYYLPLPSVPLTPDGVLDPVYVNMIKGSTKTFLEAVADVPGIDAPNSLTPTVMSRKAGNPMHRAITGIDVGRVLDTQRRRRRSLKELYSSQALELGNF